WLRSSDVPGPISRACAYIVASLSFSSVGADCEDDGDDNAPVALELPNRGIHGTLLSARAAAVAHSVVAKPSVPVRSRDSHRGNPPVFPLALAAAGTGNGQRSRPRALSRAVLRARAARRGGRARCGFAS